LLQDANWWAWFAWESRSSTLDFILQKSSFSSLHLLLFPCLYWGRRKKAPVNHAMPCLYTCFSLNLNHVPFFCMQLFVHLFFFPLPFLLRFLLPFSLNHFILSQLSFRSQFSSILENISQNTDNIIIPGTYDNTCMQGQSFMSLAFYLLLFFRSPLTVFTYLIYGYSCKFDFSLESFQHIRFRESLHKHH